LPLAPRNHSALRAPSLRLDKRTLPDLPARNSRLGLMAAIAATIAKIRHGPTLACQSCREIDLVRRRDMSPTTSSWLRSAASKRVAARPITSCSAKVGFWPHRQGLPSGMKHGCAASAASMLKMRIGRPLMSMVSPSMTLAHRAISPARPGAVVKSPIGPKGTIPYLRMASAPYWERAARSSVAGLWTGRALALLAVARQRRSPGQP